MDYLIKIREKSEGKKSINLGIIKPQVVFGALRMNIPLLICKIHFFEIESNNSTLKCTFLTVTDGTTWNISTSFFNRGEN